MTLKELTDDIAVSAQQARINGKMIKLSMDIGTVLIDLREAPCKVSNDDVAADATVHMTLDTLEKMSDKELNPMLAIMRGLVKIEGDRVAALELQHIL